MYWQPLCSAPQLLSESAVVGCFCRVVSRTEGGLVQSESSSSLKQASSQRDRNMNQFHGASLLRTQQGRSASLGFWSSKPSGFVSVLNQWFSSGFASRPNTLNSLSFVTDLHLNWNCLHKLIFVFTWFVTFYIILMLRANQGIVRNVNYKNWFIPSDIVIYYLLKVFMLRKNIFNQLLAKK